MDPSPKTPTVAILVTVPQPDHFDACTLCFDSLRTGFPNARIVATINAPYVGPGDVKVAKELQNKLYRAEVGVIYEHETLHHAAWIKRTVEQHDSRNGPLVILDADTLFWKSCEDWQFPAETLLAGYYVPHMWNDFAKCISLPRLHTSFLWMPDTAALRRKLNSIYPPALEAHGEYCPCDPFMPAVRFVAGRPYFWDTCANLYGMLANMEPLTYAFEPKHLECYDHLNSAAFYDVMLDRLNGDKEGFAWVHRFGVKTPEKLRNLWPIVNRYYADCKRRADLAPICT